MKLITWWHKFKLSIFREVLKDQNFVKDVYIRTLEKYMKKLEKKILERDNEMVQLRDEANDWFEADKGIKEITCQFCDMVHGRTLNTDMEGKEIEIINHLVDIAFNKRGKKK